MLPTGLSFWFFVGCHPENRQQTQNKHLFAQCQFIRGHAYRWQAWFLHKLQSLLPGSEPAFQSTTNQNAVPARPSTTDFPEAKHPHHQPGVGLSRSRPVPETASGLPAARLPAQRTMVFYISSAEAKPRARATVFLPGGRERVEFQKSWTGVLPRFHLGGKKTGIKTLASPWKKTSNAPLLCAPGPCSMICPSSKRIQHPVRLPSHHHTGMRHFCTSSGLLPVCRLHGSPHNARWCSPFPQLKRSPGRVRLFSFRAVGSVWSFKDHGLGFSRAFIWAEKRRV